MSDTLKAGRELDALVAEKIMGWTGIKTGIGTPPGASQPQAWHGLPVPLYSTDIAAAWQIVDKLGGDRFVLSREPGYWECDLYDAEGVQGGTPAHALCLAALAALRAVGSS